MKTRFVFPVNGLEADVAWEFDPVTKLPVACTVQPIFRRARAHVRLVSGVSLDKDDKVLEKYDVRQSGLTAKTAKVDTLKPPKPVEPAFYSKVAAASAQPAEEEEDEDGEEDAEELATRPSGAPPRK